jgi:methionyl-tRNA formyltransferase
LRVIFAGTPPFAQAALKSIYQAGFNIVQVLTQPDRPAGRGKALQLSAVKTQALELDLPIFQPLNLKTEQAQERLRALKPDVMIVAAYGLILPKAVLEIPRYGCLNIHASLLPRWRGAAPIQRAIQSGDAQTGITIMKMDIGLDTGDMLSKEAIAINPDTTAAMLLEELSSLGANMVVNTLKTLAIFAAQAQDLTGEPQDNAQATYARKLEKAEGAIDWRLPAQIVERQIRAFDPVPGSTGVLTNAPDAPIKIWRAAVVTDEQVQLLIAQPIIGTRVAGAVTLISTNAGARVLVACGASWLEVLEVQKPGGRRMSAQAWLAGQPLEGQSFFVEPVKFIDVSPHSRHDLK